MELTLQEAAVLFEVEDTAIALALGAWGKPVARRLVRDADGSIRTLYRQEQIEDALSAVAAQLLGFERD
jgi:hypothetical protein